MASLDGGFFEFMTLDNIEKFQALSKISRIRIDRDDPSIPIPSPLREMERETGVTKDQLLPSDIGSAKYVQPTVVQTSKPTIAHKPSRITPDLSNFTVRSNRAEFRAVTKKNDLPNLNVSQEQEPGTKTEVEEIPSSQSTPLVPPSDISKCSSRLDSHSDHRVDYVDSLNDLILLHNSQMESLIPCVGCGEPLFGSPCRWCTCVQCGNDIRNGSCLFCGSRDSFDYDPNPNSFNDTSNFSNYPPQPDVSSYNQLYCCEFCGGPHQGFECQTGNTFVYEQFSGNTQNFQNDQTPYYSPKQQLYCCEYCGGPHFSSNCQTGNPIPCNNYDYPCHEQPPQYQMDEDTILLELLDLLKDMKKESRRAQEDHHQQSMEELLAREQAAKRRAMLLKAAIYDDDDDDEDDEGSVIPLKDIIPQLTQSAVITPEIHTHSPIMGDELLDTVPEKESDEFIKSSVENLVPIPRESQGILEHLCDIPPPLECSKDQFETSSSSNDDCSSYGDVEYVEASLPHSDVDLLLEEFTDELTHIDPLPSGSDDDLFDFEADLAEIESLLYHDPSLDSCPNLELSDSHTNENSLSCGDISYVEELPSELVSPKENVDHLVPETFKTTVTNPLFEFESEFTLISDNPLFDTQNEDSDESLTEQGFTDLHHVNNSLHEEFSSELTHLNENENPINGVFEQNDLHHLLPKMESFSFEDFTVDDISKSFLSEDKIFKPGILPFEETHVDELSDKMSFNDKIHNLKIMKSHFDDDELVMIVIMIFFLFYTYPVTSPLPCHSFGSEDSIFDPGIFMYHL